MNHHVKFEWHFRPHSDVVGGP